MGELVLSDLLRDLVLNLVAVTVLVYAVYFRRHRRRDLVLGYIAFNISLFAVSVALGSSSPLNVGVGFGLFAVLSIVRLRSDEATQAEIGYTMVALVLGLLNGLPGLQFEVKVLFSLLLVVTMFVADHPAVLPPERHQRFRVTLDLIETDHAALAEVLEGRYGGTVKHLHILDVDHVRDTMRLDVRLRADPGVATRRGTSPPVGRARP